MHFPVVFVPSKKRKSKDSGSGAIMLFVQTLCNMQWQSPVYLSVLFGIWPEQVAVSIMSRQYSLDDGGAGTLTHFSVTGIHSGAVKIQGILATNKEARKTTNGLVSSLCFNIY